MQFERHEKVGNDYCTIQFSFNNFRFRVIESFETSFARLGGKMSKINPKIWDFPKFVTSDIISEIIHNTCFVCGGLMKDSTALQNSLVSFDDFNNDAGSRGTTQSRVGPAILKNVRKCSHCGHSHT